MNYRHFKHEGWLYALAFLFAVILRFVQLGAMPLTDMEAAPALQALQIAQGLRPTLNPHPFYILSTAVIFFIYGGGTDFLARFIPALAGSLLVFVPLLFADRIKPRAAVVLAFFLALDPGLVALSRQIASPILALTFLLFALGFYNQGKTSLAASFAALTLLSGPSLWNGVIGLAITWSILRFINSRRASAEEESKTAPLISPLSRETLIPFVAVFLVVGSLFFIVPNGLSAALASIPSFFESWLAVDVVPVIRIFFSLLVYQPLGIFLAIFAMVRGWRNGSRRIIPLSIWFFVALLLVLINPSRQLADLSWALIPLWAMSALEIVRNLDIYAEERAEVGGVAFLTAFIWTFAWLDFSGLTTLPVDSREYAMRLWLLIGSLFLLVMSLLLVAAGWSIRTARIGGILGMALVLGALGVGGAFGTAGLRGGAFPELWWLRQQPIHARLLESTVSDVSEWGIGDDHAAAVTIVGVNSPALEWTLRERRVSVVQSLDAASTPELVITPLQENPVLSSAYRGQDFAWRQTPLWDVTVPQDWIRWVALRQMPTSGETLILWVRDDLFINSTSAQ
ncbi:hypothetical protein ANAEL_00506 [Anaerolineales bacterium]|nr:hypothetical protein ANAEL_00506 [Anaerolineales bacterium]